MAEFLWQNHGRSYHRPGQCAATRFVNSGDTDDTECAQFFFVTKTAAPVHRGRRLSQFRQSGSCEVGLVTSESQFLVLAHDFVPPSSRTERVNSLEQWGLTQLRKRVTRRGILRRLRGSG